MKLSGWIKGAGDCLFTITLDSLGTASVVNQSPSPGDCEVNNNCGSVLYYFHSDHVGSSTFLSDENGLPYQFLLYLPFGETMAEQKAGGFGNRYKFNGKEQDAISGLYYYGARFYDPLIGLWLSVDPLAEQRSWVSPYNFVQNNPINRVDPTGALDNPIYDTDGNFLGTDDKGLQGKAIVMDNKNFTQGMSHEKALSHNLGAKGLSSSKAQPNLLSHYNGLINRPDYDGFVSVQEGISWAKAHLNALYNPTPDNTLYLDASKLNFGNISISDFGNGVGKSSPINLLNMGNLTASMGNETLRATVYALGRVDMQLHDKTGTVSIINNNATDYDWNTGGGALRNSLIKAERARAGLNDTHGFKTYYYGKGTLNPAPKPYTTPALPVGPKW